MAGTMFWNCSGVFGWRQARRPVLLVALEGCEDGEGSGFEELLPFGGDEAVAVFLRVAGVAALLGGGGVVDVAVGVSGDEGEGGARLLFDA